MKLPRVKLPRMIHFVLHEPSVPATVEALPSPPDTGIDFATDWARRPAARIVRRVLQEVVMEPVVAVMLRPKLRNTDRLSSLDDNEAVIFAANHSSHADTPLLLRTLPKPWRDHLFVGAAADYFFPNRLAGTASSLLLNAIPIERSKVTRRSALEAARLINDGWSMVIYPEGGRSPDGWGQRFRGGAAFLSNRTGAPVVPIHVSGTDKVLPKGKRWPTPGRATVSFGEPIRPRPEEDSRSLSARIEKAVATLADEGATDWWQARRRFHAGTTPARTGPDHGTWRRSWALGADAARTRSDKTRWPKR